MFTEEDNILINREFDTLKMASLKRCTNQEEYDLVVKAFDFANEAHKDVRRRSGEPYILHPIAVAMIVASDIGLGYQSICAALLHDVVEDTDYTKEDIERHFGKEISLLVEGLTKIKFALDNNDKGIEKISQAEKHEKSDKTVSAQAENYKRILLTLNDDFRIVLIKMADRLHNMRTIQYMPEYKREKILSETMVVFIPLAHRLGFYLIKTEMENIWLQYKEPEAYDELTEKLNDIKLAREVAIKQFEQPIIEALANAGYNAKVLDRLKSPYSVWNKMRTKGVTFEQIYDIYATRIIFTAKTGIDEQTQCNHISNLVSTLYHIKGDRTRNWLGDNRKNNGYEALHITVMSSSGFWVEVQIRSESMDQIAEKGIAAHWLYKETTQEDREKEVDKMLNQVRDALESPDTEAQKFMDVFHNQLLSSKIYTFTPKGDTRRLPKGSTALDFAYDIHTHIGNSAIAAKVNQKLQPLSFVLNNGDQVEIITSDSATPKREWLDFLQTSKAKNMLIDALKDVSRDNIKAGIEILKKKLSEHNVTLQSRVIKKLHSYYKIEGGKDEMYMKIGLGLIDLSDLEKALKTNAEKRKVQMWGVKILDPIVNLARIDKKKEYELKENVEDGTISFDTADCCSPIPGDNVVAFVDDNGQITIHKKSCPVANNLAAKEGYRIISVKWSKHFMMSFLTRISINGIDRMGVINELTKVISLVLGVNIRKIMIESHDEIFEGYIDLYVHSIDDLNKLIKSLSQIKGVESVKRVEINSK